MMNSREIRAYWESRATGDSSAQSTTQDVYLREIESAALSERIPRYNPGSIADVGCGDGRTTSRLAEMHPRASFAGFDYSAAMVENARRVNDSAILPNIRFEALDICEGLKGSFDLIYTTRCLINLPTWELQKAAIKNIADALTGGGAFLMVENFVEGQANFNAVRERFQLPAIPIREHNLFFEKRRLTDYLEGMFKIDEEVNISSTYYLVSRVIYSKICADENIQPDYFDDHHRLAAGLPFCGEFGPVRLVCLTKR
jgi:trans-aconitate methyltransferase